MCVDRVDTAGPGTTPDRYHTSDHPSMLSQSDDLLFLTLIWPQFIFAVRLNLYKLVALYKQHVIFISSNYFLQVLDH